MMFEVSFTRYICEAITQRAASLARFNVKIWIDVRFLFLLTLSTKIHIVPMKRTELHCFVFNVLEQ